MNPKRILEVLKSDPAEDFTGAKKPQAKSAKGKVASEWNQE